MEPQSPRTASFGSDDGLVDRHSGTAVEGFVRDAEAIADTCYHMARRFHRGGRLFAFGTGASVADAHHVAVEFVHPVIVGKRALPAVALSGDESRTAAQPSGAPADVFSHQLRLLARPQDIALGLSTEAPDAAVVQGLAAASSLGMLTVALTGGGAEPGDGRLDAHHHLVAASADPLTARELQVTTYHILWELVHVFFEQPGLLGR